MIINPYDKKSMAAAALYAVHHKKRIGLTSGTFDMFHDNHLRYIERCRRLCDILVVGVDSDRAVKAAKGEHRPIMSEFQRLMIMDAIKYVWCCYIQDDLATFTKVAEYLMVRPINGRVFRNDVFKDRESEVAIGAACAEVIIVPDIDEPNSTTRIVQRVKEEPKC